MISSCTSCTKHVLRRLAPFSTSNKAWMCVCEKWWQYIRHELTKVIHSSWVNKHSSHYSSLCLTIKHPYCCHRSFTTARSYWFTQSLVGFCVQFFCFFFGGIIVRNYMKMAVPPPFRQLYADFRGLSCYTTITMTQGSEYSKLAVAPQLWLVSLIQCVPVFVWMGCFIVPFWFSCHRLRIVIVSGSTGIIGLTAVHSCCHWRNKDIFSSHFIWICVHTGMT